MDEMNLQIEWLEKARENHQEVQKKLDFTTNRKLVPKTNTKQISLKMLPSAILKDGWTFGMTSRRWAPWSGIP